MPAIPNFFLVLAPSEKVTFISPEGGTHSRAPLGLMKRVKVGAFSSRENTS
jgi:hypothetical protein